MPKALSYSKVQSVLAKLDSGLSITKISTATGVSVGTISNICSEHRPNLPKSSGGRPAKLTPTDVRHTVCLVTSSNSATATQTTQELKSITGTSVDHSTLRRHLCDAGLKAVVKQKKPLLTAAAKKACLQFARAHRYWTLEDWKKLGFSDKMKINCLGSDGMHWVWKKEGEGLSERLVEGTMKFGGGNIMMWGCMFWEGTGYATKIEGTMNTDLYIEVLEDKFAKFMEFCGKGSGNVIF